MTFEQFTQAHAGRDFQSFSAFTDEVRRAGLSDADRQRAYAAWRVGWGRAVTGGGELVQRQPGKPKHRAPIGPDWTRPQWLHGEAQIEEAFKQQAAGHGQVIEDGHPPAQWIPKEQTA